jgi:hypothetical protein
MGMAKSSPVPPAAPSEALGTAGSGVRPSAVRQPVVLVVEAAPAVVDVVRCAISAVDHTIRLGGCSAEALDAAVEASRPFLIVVDSDHYAREAGRLQVLARSAGSLLVHVRVDDEVAELEYRLITLVAEGFARYRHECELLRG